MPDVKALPAYKKSAIGHKFCERQWHWYSGRCQGRQAPLSRSFTNKPTGEGAARGLSIRYEIVTQEHGGTITVGSQVGGFTEFTVRLPRAYGATTAEAA